MASVETEVGVYALDGDLALGAPGLAGAAVEIVVLTRTGESPSCSRRHPPLSRHARTTRRITLYATRARACRGDRPSRRRF